MLALQSRDVHPAVPGMVVSMQHVTLLLPCVPMKRRISMCVGIDKRNEAGAGCKGELRNHTLFQAHLPSTCLWCEHSHVVIVWKTCQ